MDQVYRDSSAHYFADIREYLQAAADEQFGDQPLIQTCVDAVMYAVGQQHGVVQIEPSWPLRCPDDVSPNLYYPVYYTLESLNREAPDSWQLDSVLDNVATAEQWAQQALDQFETTAAGEGRTSAVGSAAAADEIPAEWSQYLTERFDALSGTGPQGSLISSLTPEQFMRELRIFIDARKKAVQS